MKNTLYLESKIDKYWYGTETDLIGVILLY
jgi:hypothetical protein